MGRPYLRLELGGGKVAETHVGALFVVVPPPAIDPDLASIRFRNHSRDRHSFRNFPLNDLT